MFLGSFDWQAVQIVLTCNSENFVTLEKKDPWDVKWFSSLSILFIFIYNNNNNNENFIEIYILLIYTIVNLTLIKVIYNWLHESHKTTNTSTNSRNNDLNDYAMFSILIL